jgi:hypothetical protein
MTLPLADIDRWSAESVRTVVRAATARGHAAQEASRQLGALPVFDTWHGVTAEARRQRNAAIRRDLDAHGSEALSVARAASKAADGIEQVQFELRTLRHDAADLRMTIDALSNQVVPSAMFNGSPKEATRAEMRLKPRLDAIVAEANAIDAELATAITLADGDNHPLPDDPKKFNESWNRLTPEEKDRVYSRDHNIGNHAGMPWDPTDHRGKDHYNRLHLRELEQQAEADVDRIGHNLDQVMVGFNIDDGALYALQSQLLAVQRTLARYRAVRADVERGDGLSRFLGILDDTGHGAVAIGNPDIAKCNGIFVPGTGEDLARLPFSDRRAAAMYGAAHTADSTLGPADVAITTWMGYDRPMDLGQAAFPDPARAGAVSLDAFENGLRASHVGPRSIDTVIGHSYGSTLVGAAASGGHCLGVDNVIAVGSPGMLVDRVGGFSLAPGARVYAMRAANDIISLSGVIAEWTLGPDPTAPHFGARRLAADPGPTGPLGLPSVAAHSGYWDQSNIALANMAAVIAGKTG